MKNQARDIASTVVELSRHYAIWHEIVKPNIPGRTAVVQQYEDLFASTALAHFSAFCILTYQIYDKRKDVISICRLLDSLRTSDPQMTDAVEKEITANWAVITRIFAIRGNVYAHRARLITAEEVFLRANLTPDLMGSIVSLAQDHAAKLLDATGADSYIDFINEVNNREYCARDDVERLFERLANDT